MRYLVYKKCKELIFNRLIDKGNKVLRVGKTVICI